MQLTTGWLAALYRELLRFVWAYFVDDLFIVLGDLL